MSPLLISPQGDKMDFSKSKYPDVQKSERPNVQYTIPA